MALFTVHKSGALFNNASKNIPVLKIDDISELEKIYPRLEKSDIKRLFAETWRPYFLEYDSFTQFRERPFKGRYVNIDKNRFRISKNQGPWPLCPSSYNIFIFGGGTAFGYGVPDGKTIASCLQELLSEKTGRRICIYNFGRCFYYSSQERMLFENLLISGHIPDMAIFIDGINDFGNIKDLPLFSSAFGPFMGGKDPAYDNIQSRLEILQMTVDALPLIKNNGIDLLEKYNLADLPEQLKTIKFSDIYNQEALSLIISSMINRYLENKKIIEAVSEKAGIHSLFVWQPIPSHNSEPEQDQSEMQRILSFHFSRQGYPEMKKIMAKGSLKSNFLWCADLQETRNDWPKQSSLIYSEEMTKSLSGLIADSIVKMDLLHKNKWPHFNAL